MTANNLSIQEIERLTGILLGMGVLFNDAPTTYDDDDEYDRGQIDFEALYKAVVQREPILLEFIDYVRTIQAPQHREWRILIPQLKAGNNYARERLIEMYLRSVVKIAYSFSLKYDAPMFDTLEDGFEGFLKSLDKYDLSEHGVFQSYYPMWVMQNITRNMSFMPNPLLYFPVHVRDTLYKIFDNVEAAGGIGVADLYSENLVKSVIEELGCSVEEAQRLLGFFEPMLSFEEMIASQEDEYFNDHGLFEDELIEHADRITLHLRLNELLQQLKPREVSVLELRYGLKDGKTRTLEEIGELYGLTRERIRQIEAKGLRKLSHPSRLQILQSFIGESTAVLS